MIFKLKLNINIVYAIFGFSVLVFGSACKKSPEVKEPDFGYSYFPLDSGIYRLYQVDSIAFDDNTNTSDTFSFMMEEQQMGLVQGQDLDKHRVMHRRVTNDGGKTWVPRSSNYAVITGNQLQMVVDNNRIVKLIFPVGNTPSWNGNMYNGLGRRTFQVSDLGKTFSDKGEVFEDCVTVQEANTKNAIEEIYFRSIYANGIGLVDETNNYLNIQTSGVSGYKIHSRLKVFIRP